MAKVRKTQENQTISASEFVVIGDNRNIFDNSRQQKLDDKDIEEMKKQGLEGEAIINKLIEGSQNFHLRTQFSKEKYIRKKMEKYMPKFEVRKPTALDICEAYACSPKICLLRSDMMGYILNMSNVNSQSRVLLVEHTRGFMAGAVAEREPAYTLRVEFGTESIKCSNEVLDQFDFTPGLMMKMGYINGKMLVETDKGNPDPMLKAIQAQYKKKFNSFIFVHDELHPMEVYNSLKQYLQPSASFAIYSIYLQPLAELLNQMNFDKDTVNAKIEELFMRELQVLPLRTHPHMSMHGQSGFVLVGQKLA